MTRRFFTDAERAFIDAHVHRMTSVELGAALGRHYTSIKNYLMRSGLRKGSPGPRFPKGHVPHNKGVKGWKPAGSEKGQFKPGHVPHNATGYTDGMVVVRHKAGEAHAYKYRRLAKGRWVLSHRHNWQQAHGGPVPAGHVLRCVDGDTLNDAPGNWQAITRAANAALNAIHAGNRASTRLTDAYVAATLTKNNPGLRPLVLACPDLLAAQRGRLTLNRTIQHVVETQTR